MSDFAIMGYMTSSHDKIVITNNLIMQLFYFKNTFKFINTERGEDIHNHILLYHKVLKIDGWKHVLLSHYYHQLEESIHYLTDNKSEVSIN